MQRLFDEQEKIAAFVLGMDLLLDMVPDHEALRAALITLFQKSSSDSLSCKALSILCGPYLSRHPSHQDEIVKVILSSILLNASVRTPPPKKLENKKQKKQKPSKN